MKLRGKFTAAFLGAGLIPLLLGFWFSHHSVRRAMEDLNQTARDALAQKAHDQLTALLHAKASQIRGYFENLQNEVAVITHDRSFIQAFGDFGGAFSSFRSEADIDAETLDARRAALRQWYAVDFAGAYARVNEGRVPEVAAYADALSPDSVALQYAFFVQQVQRGKVPEETPNHQGTRYLLVHARAHPFWQRANQRLGFRDLHLVSGEAGTVVYSTRKDIDFGASLMEGPLAQSAMARAYQAAAALKDAEGVVMTDYAPFTPALGEVVCFLATPVFDGEKRVGVAIVEVGLESINQIMGARTGLGDSGEMFLLGSDLLRRSDSSVSSQPQDQVRYAMRHPEESRLQLQPLQGIFIAEESGTTLAVERGGRQVLLAYAPINVLGQEWGIAAKIDLAEAFAAATDMDAKAARAIENLLYMSDGIVVLAILLLLVVAFAVSRSISKPLRRTVSILHDMAQGGGDVSQRLYVQTRDEVGELAQWFNTFMDKVQEVYSELEEEVGRRKHAQAKVEQSRQYYKTLIENAPDVIAVVDEAIAAQFLSPSFERTLGYAREELLGRRLLQLVHPEDMQRVHDVVQEVLQSPLTPLKLYCRLQHASGEWREVEFVLSNHLQDAVVEGIVINLRDVTEREQAEHILREYSARLEEDVRERTLELEKNRDDLSHALERLKSTQEKLILNEKMASLGALTAGIAHEIKNPLNFINNFADLSQELAQELEQIVAGVQEAWPEEKRAEVQELLHDLRQNAQRIVQHGRRADSIVRNMLLHSRGKPGERTPTDINALLDEYVHLAYHGMRARYPAFNITMDLDLAPELPQAPVIAQDLARVFLNILNNACYATYQRAQLEPGFRGVLRVVTRDAGAQVEVRIRDNGAGIPEEVRADIFNPFFTTKPAGEGTGLGLSISYDIIVRQHGGELSVRTEPNTFTEFTILLPKQVPADEESTIHENHDH